MKKDSVEFTPWFFKPNKEQNLIAEFTREHHAGRGKNVNYSFLFFSAYPFSWNSATNICWRRSCKTDSLIKGAVDSLTSLVELNFDLRNLGVATIVIYLAALCRPFRFSRNSYTTLLPPLVQYCFPYHFYHTLPKPLRTLHPTHNLHVFPNATYPRGGKSLCWLRAGPQWILWEYKRECFQGYPYLCVSPVSSIHSISPDVPKC